MQNSLRPLPERLREHCCSSGENKTPLLKPFSVLSLICEGDRVCADVCLSVHPYGDSGQIGLKAASLKPQRVPLGVVAVGVLVEERPPGWRARGSLR